MFKCLEDNKTLCLTITICFILFIEGFSQKVISKEDLAKYNYQEVVDATEEGVIKLDNFAMYPNGFKGIQNHIKTTLRYPVYAQNNNIEGDVIVEFVVGKSGKVKKAKVVQKVSKELDKEALRVILSLKRFYPGFLNNKPIRLRFAQVIGFRLE